MQSPEGLSLVWIHESDEFAEIDLGEPIMEFRLTYQGPLLAARDPNHEPKSRLKHKHILRRSFHEQLKQLWMLDPRMAPYAEKHTFVRGDGVTISTGAIDQLQKHYESHGVKWAPLINDRWGIVCSLDVLFLRREPKGGIYRGDLDNRIKTLFDALTIPGQNAAPDDLVANNEPDPFFCLLSDDSLIAEFRVTSDRLLASPTDSKGEADVQLIIGVKTFVGDHEKASRSIGGFFHQ